MRTWRVRWLSISSPAGDDTSSVENRLTRREHGVDYASSGLGGSARLDAVRERQQSPKSSEKSYPTTQPMAGDYAIAVPEVLLPSHCSIESLVDESKGTCLTHSDRHRRRPASRCHLDIARFSASLSE
jgi:hypothetical protein